MQILIWFSAVKNYHFAIHVDGLRAARMDACKQVPHHPSLVREWLNIFLATTVCRIWTDSYHPSIYLYICLCIYKSIYVYIFMHRLYYKLVFVSCCAFSFEKKWSVHSIHCRHSISDKEVAYELLNMIHVDCNNSHGILQAGNYIFPNLK